MKPIIRVENVSKRFLIGEGQKSSSLLREHLADLVRTPFKSLRRYKFTEKNSFWALRDISFEIKPGEVWGIIGRNGAGKSTLLRILSRITEPTGGRIELYGRIGSLLEVGTGFHPDLTGRENVFLNGTILGMTRKEVAKKFDEIVDFAGIGKFLDTAVKYYSTGMYTRLAFAVAAHLETEILIVDEVLAVGDVEFQQKCLGKMSEVSRQGRTVLFVSHTVSAVRQLCEKAIFLEKGKVEYEGKVNGAIDLYLKKSTAISKAYVRTEANNSASIENKGVSFKKISLHSVTGTEKYNFRTDERIVVKFELEIEKIVENAVIFLMILDKDKAPFCMFQSDNINSQMILEIDAEFLVRGTYSFHALIHIPNQIQFDSVEDEVIFEIEDSGTKFKMYGSYNYGLVFGKGIWN